MKAFQKQMIAGALVIVLLLLAGWFLLVSPRMAAAAELRQETEAARATGQSLEADIAALKRQAVELPIQQRRLQTFAQLMPPTADLPSLIRSLTAAAQTAQADLISITPSVVAAPVQAPIPAPVPGTSPSAGSAANGAAVPRSGAAAVPGTAAVAGAVGASPVPVSITVSGQYFVLERFLTALEGLPRALVVNTVGLSSSSSTTGTASVDAGLTSNASSTNPTLTAAVSLSAYTSTAVSAAPTVSPTPAPSPAGIAGSQP